MIKMRFKVMFRNKVLVSELEIDGLDIDDCELQAYDYAYMILDEDFGINSEADRDLVELVAL